MTKRHLRILGAGLSCLLLLATCKKGESIIDPPDPPEPDFSGKWSGTYGDSVSNGTFTFTFTQNDTIVAGSYSAISSVGFAGGGTVSGNISGKNFQVQTSATSGSCTIVNNVSGSCTGFQRGSSLSATYAGTNTCGGSWSNGTLALTKQ